MFVDFYDSAVAGAAYQNVSASQSMAATPVSSVIKPLMCVTASMDGFIKMCSTADLQTKKCFFVS